MFAALGVCATGVRAEVPWQADVFALAEAFSARVLAQTADGSNLDHIHDMHLAEIARALGTTPDEARTGIIEGYRFSIEMLEVLEHRQHPENAVFGETSGMEWGIVPFSGQARMRGSTDPMPEWCSSMLYYRVGERWFMSAIDTPERQRPLLAAFPDFLALPIDDLPGCEAPAS